MNIVDYFTIWRRILKRKPIGFSIDITHSCTLSCQTCYMKWYQGLPELTAKDWKKVISSYHENHRYYGAWTGGEPLLRAGDIKKLIHLFKWNWIATNGTLELPHWDNVSFLVSIDGNEEIHNKQRGECWSNIVRHIRDDCFIIYDITQLNKDEKTITETVQFWHKRCRGIIFGFYTPAKQDNSGLLLSSEERKAAVGIIKGLKNRYGGFIINSIRQLQLCCHTPWGDDCPAGNCIVGLDAQGKLKKPCVMGPEVDCSLCGCAVPQFMYLVKSLDIRAILSSMRILSR